MEPLTPPQSPLHSPSGPSPADTGCYSYFSSASSPCLSSHPSPHNHHHHHSRHHDPLTATFVSLALSSRAPTADTHGRGDRADADTDTETDSDSERERRRRLGAEDVRRKRQLMARMQTSDDVLRQLGELVKRVVAAPGPGSRKSSTGLPGESGGVSKKPAKGHHHHHHHHHRHHHHRVARTGKAPQSSSPPKRNAVVT